VDHNRVSRVVSSPMLRAQRYQALMAGDPTIKSRADLARELGITRARVTQVLGLLDLAPEIQEALLALGDQDAVRFLSEHRLRPLLRLADPAEQVREFERLLAQAPGRRPGHDN